MTIGAALLDHEQRGTFARRSSELSFAEFREELVFVPVEVLESYLEDLLNIKVTEEDLFISQKPSRLALFTYEAILITVAITVGAIAALLGASRLMAFAATFISIIPMLCIYYLSPLSARRRMRFAQVLSKEISRRRGRDDDGIGRTGVTTFSEWLIRPQSGGVQGAAKITLH